MVSRSIWLFCSVTPCYFRSVSTSTRHSISNMSEPVKHHALLPALNKFSGSAFSIDVEVSPGRFSSRISVSTKLEDAFVAVIITIAREMGFLINENQFSASPSTDVLDWHVPIVRCASGLYRTELRTDSSDDICTLIVVPICHTMVINLLTPQLQSFCVSYDLSKYFTFKSSILSMRNFRELRASFQTVLLKLKKCLLDESSLRGPHILSLPQEILIHLCKYLTPTSFCRFTSTCKRLAPLAHDETIWRSLSNIYHPLRNNTDHSYKSFVQLQFKYSLLIGDDESPPKWLLSLLNDFTEVNDAFVTILVVLAHEMGFVISGVPLSSLPSYDIRSLRALNSSHIRNLRSEENGSYRIDLRTNATDDICTLIAVPVSDTMIINLLTPSLESFNTLYNVNKYVSVDLSIKNSRELSISFKNDLLKLKNLVVPCPSQNRQHILHLPVEVLIHICKFLTPVSFGRFACTCKQISLLFDDETVWKSIAKSYFSSNMVSSSGWKSSVRSLLGKKLGVRNRGMPQYRFCRCSFVKDQLLV